MVIIRLTDTFWGPSERTFKGFGKMALIRKTGNMDYLRYSNYIGLLNPCRIYIFHYQKVDLVHMPRIPLPE